MLGIEKMIKSILVLIVVGFGIYLIYLAVTAGKTPIVMAQEQLGIGERGACYKDENSFWCEDLGECVEKIPGKTCNPEAHEPASCSDWCNPATCRIGSCPDYFGCYKNQCTDCKKEGEGCEGWWPNFKGHCCDGLDCGGDHGWVGEGRCII